MHPLTDAWWRLFVNSTDGSLRARGTTSVFAPRPLTRPEMSQARDGQRPLSVYAADEGGFSRWLYLDADTEAGSVAPITIAQTMEPGTCLFEPSRRGAHLWRSCPPTPWSQVRDYGLWLCDEAGITCEVFPKGAGRTGVKLPLTVHPKSGLRYPVIDPTTGEIVPEEQLAQLQPAALAVAQFARTLPKAVAPGEQQTDFEALYREIAAVTNVASTARNARSGTARSMMTGHPSLSIVGGFWRCWAGCGEGGLNAFRARLRERHLV